MKRLFLMLIVFSGAVRSDAPPDYFLDPIIVTATRYPQRLSRVPWGSSVIARRDLEWARLGLNDVLALATGCDLRPYGDARATSMPAVRGAPASQVLVLVDGRPLNSPSLGVADVGLVPLIDIGRIEIVRGPISSIYGSSATSVINVITDPVRSRSHASADISLAYPGSIRAGGSIGTGDRTRTRLSGEYDRDPGRRTNSDLATRDLRLRLEATAAHVGPVALAAGYGDRAMGLPGPLPGSEIPVYGDSSATSIYDRQTDQNIHANGSLLLPLARGFSAEGRLYADQSVNTFRSVYDRYNPDWTRTRIDQHDRYQTRSAGATVTLRSPDVTPLTGAVGADARVERLGVESRAVPSDSGPVDSTRWNPGRQELALWVEGRWEPGRLIAATASGRYDRNSAYGGFPSMSLGIILTPRNGWQTKASLGRSFRAPTFNDLFWPRSGNPGLRPEQSWTGEIRLEERSRLVAWDLAVYGRRTRDLIAWVPDTAGLWHPQNVDRLELAALESELRFEPVARLALSGNATAMIARQTRLEPCFYDAATGQTRLRAVTRPAAFLPGVQGSAALTLNPAGGFSARLELRHRSARRNYYPDYSALPDVRMVTKELPAVWLVSVNVRQALGRFVVLRAGVDNLLDRRYAEQFGNSPQDRDYPMPRRTVYAGVSLEI